MLRVLVAGLAVGLCAAAAAQDASWVSATAALKDAPVTVWVVTPGNQAERTRALLADAQKFVKQHAAAPGYSESTAGSFGKPSSEIGQTAGSAGQTAGSFGRTASSVGQNAGSYQGGLPGGNASDTGQSASSYGQTAGSFGQTSSTFGQTLGGQSLGPAPPAAQARPLEPIRNRDREQYLTGIPGVTESMRLVGVATEELLDRLQAVEGTPAYPDVLLAAPHPLGGASDKELTMLGWPDGADADPPHTEKSWRDLWPTILVKAPHPAQARAYVVYLRDGTSCWDCGHGSAEKVDPLVSEAIAVAGQVLSGNGLGMSADADAARFSGPLAQTISLAAYDGNIPQGLAFRVDAKQQVAISDHLAIVPLRTIVSSPTAFGVAHSLVVLRKNDQGKWKVLQLSSNLGTERLAKDISLWNTLAAAAKPRPTTSCRRCDTKVVATSAPAPELPLRAPSSVPLGVSLAAPADDDTRSPQPPLWWDNKGGAVLQVVEWQMQLGEGDRWTDPRVQLVPDLDFRVQTQVAAAFATMPGLYKWRVWSVAKDGTTVLTPWRRLHIVR